MTLGDIIAEFREQHQISMDAFAEMSGISKGYISMLERNKTHRGEEPSPSYEMYKNVAKTINLDVDELIRMVEGKILLRVEDEQGVFSSLTPSEQRVGLAYGKASLRDQRTVEHVLEPYMEALYDVIYVKWRISEQAAAAGNGIYLGPETFTEYEVDESKLPHGAAFGVPISGDSMEPKYHDGDIAIISKDFPDVGQVGLFTFDGNGYIKKRGDGVLESFNPKYDDILITDDVIINGRVIGVITWDDVRK